MDYEVVWTEPARDDLEEITRYIAQHNPTAAERIANAIVDQTALLATTPYMGTAFSTGGTGQQRFVVSGKYRIFYRVKDDEKRVEILVVRHGKRRDPDLPED